MRRSQLIARSFRPNGTYAALRSLSAVIRSVTVSTRSRAYWEVTRACFAGGVALARLSRLRNVYLAPCEQHVYRCRGSEAGQMIRNNDDMIMAVAGLCAGLTLCRCAAHMPKIRSTAEQLLSSLEASHQSKRRE